MWAEMQKASLETLIKVQYLEVDGPQTPENAQTYLASLAMGKCDLVLTVGDAPVGALAQVAPRFPAVRFRQCWCSSGRGQCVDIGRFGSRCRAGAGCPSGCGTAAR